jgi:hypothetical protein
MLALAASYGVYNFARLFVPPWVAVVQAAAFELVYIGLAVTQLTPAQRRRATAIALGAVCVSMAYNSLDGLFHRRPELLATPPLWMDVCLALLHGVPLAALAYLVSDLLLHRESSSTSAELLRRVSTDISDSFSVRVNQIESVNDLPVVAGRPGVTLADLLAVLPADFSRETAVSAGVASVSTVDKLLADGLAAGRLERVARGQYRVVEEQ